jgi:hypothetical protein
MQNVDLKLKLPIFELFMEHAGSVRMELRRKLQEYKDQQKDFSASFYENLKVEMLLPRRFVDILFDFRCYNSSCNHFDVQKILILKYLLALISV